MQKPTFRSAFTIKGTSMKKLVVSKVCSFSLAVIIEYRDNVKSI